jgi:hypothetical protein
VDAFVPANVAESVTVVPAGTEIVAPEWPPPDSEVLTAVAVGTAVTVSISAPQVLEDPWLALSPL